MSQILMIVTAADAIELADGTSHPTGFWAEELVTAHRAFREAGARVVVATPYGAKPHVDPGSLTAAIVGDQRRVDEFSAYLAGIDGELSRPVSVGDVNVADFDAIVIPGGHGPMVDLANDDTTGALLTKANGLGRIIAPFCHGPAALLSATRTDGSFAFKGRRLTVFTDEEELTGGIGEKTPWLVASVLAERGAVIESAEAWTSHVVRDENLISGQNPQSSSAVAAAVLAALAE